MLSELSTYLITDIPNSRTCNHYCSLKKLAVKYFLIVCLILLPFCGVGEKSRGKKAHV